MISSHNDANCTNVDHEKLRAFIESVLERLSVPVKDGKRISDVLVEADLRGFDTHGIGRFHIYVDRLKSGAQSPTSKITVLSESSGTALLDGGGGMGHVISTEAMKLAIKKAEENGIGAVAVRNSSHFGFTGYYPLMASSEGMVGVAFTNARPSTCPTFGTEPILGTNPIAFSAPTDLDFPFLFDAATSIVQRGAVEMFERNGQVMPDGLVTGSDGVSLNDPSEILKKLLSGEAALLPLGGLGEINGGHKGYGLSVMVEILSAAFQNGPYLKQVTGIGMGHFFIAIDVSKFLPLEAFRSVAGAILRDLQNSRKEKEASRIYVAGEKEHETRSKRLKSGIPITPELMVQLDSMAQELSVPRLL